MPVPTISGRPLLHPGDAFRAVLEQATPVDFWQRANSYTCPLGAEPGSAWLLMKRKDLDALDNNAAHALVWKEGAKTILSIASLLIVKSSVMNLALAGDKDAACLVEFQDERRILKKFSSINSQYNVRIPAPSTTTGAGLYYTDSIDTSVVWTWQTMLDDIWGNLPGANTAPTLPYTPDGTPEGWRFIGETAWDALHEVLAKINCTTAYNPILDTHTYIRLGTTQDGLAFLLNGFRKRLMYDYDPGQDYQLANMPETVRVFFQRRELYHGIERDTPDANNWEMEPVVSKDRATSIVGATVGTVLNVWDDLPAEFDDTGVNSNSAALQTRANEIGDNVRDRINVSDERLRRMFSGLVTPILPGSEITEVVWRDYGDETGLVTEVIRRPPEGTDSPSARQLWTGEKLQTPDLDRATHPLWPRLSQPVRVDDGSSPGETGKMLSPNVDGLFPGFVRRWANGAWIDLDACWIRPVDLQGTNENTVADLRQLDTLIGRLSGVETSESSTRPVYLVREGSGSASKGAPIGTVWGGVLAPQQNIADGLWYMDRDGLPDTDWAHMDGVSNAVGSGMAMLAADGDTFFVRALGSRTNADDTAFGRTVASPDPNKDIITLQDHEDHSHETLGLCNAQYQLGSGGDPRLCAYPASGEVCDIECTSGVRDEALGSCGGAADDGVLQHTFSNGQGTDPGDPDDFNVAPPNKAWHWFERIAETGATGTPPSAAIFQPTSQPMPVTPVAPMAAGGLWQGDGTASPGP